MGNKCFGVKKVRREQHINGHSKPLSKSSLKKINEQMDSVCKIIKEKTSGTGFICSIPFPNKLTTLPVLITCYHVLGDKDLESGKEIKIIFNENEKILKIDESRKIYTSNKTEYDISIIELKSEDNFDLNNLLEIENDIFIYENLNLNYKNKSIYIIHYPNGNEIKYSVDTVKNIDVNNKIIDHCCSTEEGSSGGPIFYLDTYRILAIHRGKHAMYNYNIGTILKFPINEFNKKYKNNINQKLTINSNNSNEKKIIKKDILNEENSINIEILDSYICTINYKLSKKNIKDVGFFVKILNSNPNDSITGFLTKYHVEEYTLKKIKTINIYENHNLLDKLDSKDRFYFSDEFLDATFFEINNSKIDFINILEENNISGNLLVISYSHENNSINYTEGKILEKWGTNIIYKEIEDIFYSDYKSSYCDAGLLMDEQLIGIHKQIGFKNKIATNIEMISKAIKLNYFSKIKNNSKYIEKEEKKFLNENQINDLKKNGLEISNIPNIFISAPSLFVTPIWFYRTKHAWYWTPTKPEKSDLNKTNWMIIYPKNSLKVIGGIWDGNEPAEKNINLIHWLETTELKYLN